MFLGKSLNTSPTMFFPYTPACQVSFGGGRVMVIANSGKIKH